jgi:hypothetical protein
MVERILIFYGSYRSDRQGIVTLEQQPVYLH